MSTGTIAVQVTIQLEVANETEFRQAAYSRASIQGNESPEDFLDAAITGLDQCGCMIIDPGVGPAGANIMGSYAVVMETRKVSETTNVVGAATLFWRELNESVESLPELADQHGPRTLADLMYLQNAILSGGYIDHYPGESNTLEIVKALPSADRWLQFVKIEEMENAYDAPAPGMM